MKIHNFHSQIMLSGQHTQAVNAFKCDTVTVPTASQFWSW